MSNIILRILKFLGFTVLGKKVQILKRRAERLLRIYLAMNYIKAIQVVRQAMIGFALLFFVTLIIGSGFFMLNMGLGLIIYNKTGNLANTALFFLVAGCMYFFIPIFFFLYLASERRWLRIFRVKSILKFATVKTSKRDCEKKGDY